LDVLALAFHVTYWDYLGWKDPFSLKIATDRQERYGRRFGDGSYTPEIVVDGATGIVGSYRADVDRAILDARMNGATAADVQVMVRSGEVSIDVGAGKGAARVFLVGFDRERVTQIGRGENRGRAEIEANVVRSFRPIAEWRGAAIHLSERIPQGEQLAIILEAPDGRIVGASRAIDTGSS
jgi:hypothetical protein